MFNEPKLKKEKEGGIGFPESRQSGCKGMTPKGGSKGGRKRGEREKGRRVGWKDHNFWHMS